MSRSAPITLCLVTQPMPEAHLVHEQFILDAVRGGVTMVQLRSKTHSKACLEQTASRLITLLRPLGVPVIMNDSVELALAVNADGVHLGQTDMHPDLARGMLGANKFIGLSIETFAQLEAANQLNSLSYVAASAVFPSQSKSNCRTIWGLDGLARIARMSRYPVVAIGGIGVDSAPQVMAAGAAGIAVISAIHQARNAEVAAKELITAMQVAC